MIRDVIRTESKSTDNLALAARNAAFSLLSLVARMVGNVVVFLMIARLPGIGTSDFGQLTYAVALASLFVLISQFGLVPLMIRDVASNHSLVGDFVRSVFGLRLLLSALGYLGLVICVHFLGLSEQGRLVCYVMGLALYIGSISIDIQAVFQSQERMNLELPGIFLENGLLLVSTLLAYILEPDIVWIASIFLIAKFSALLLNYAMCARKIIWLVPRFDLVIWRRLSKAAVPFVLSGLIAAGIVQIDTILLHALSSPHGDATVGIYQAAMRLFLLPMLIPEIFIKVFLPQLSRMHGAKGLDLVRDLGRINHMLLTAGLLIGLVTMFRSEDLIHLIYGDRYVDAGEILQVLGLSIMLRFGAAYNLYFTLRNRVWLRVWSALAALASAIILNMIFIPRYGALGAAYASVLAHIVYWIPYLVAIFVTEKSMRLGWRPVPALVAAGLVALMLYSTNSLPLIAMLPIYTVACGLGVLLTMPSMDRVRIKDQLFARFTR